MKKQWVLVAVLAGALIGSSAAAQHKAPNQQPTTDEAPKVPTGDVALGRVRLPRPVTADGKPLPAGTYQVRVTEQESKPDVVGATEELERWAEFLRNGKVVGREVVTIVPQSEVKLVTKDTPPAPGASKVQVLRGNDYLRVWFNRSGTHYLVHFPVEAGAKKTTQ